MALKTLYFLRHAKAIAAEGNMDDHERPLNARGEQDALKVGAYMKQQGIAPALTLCSTSLRTRQTLHLLETAMDAPLNARLAARLYLASPKEMIEEIVSLQEPVQSLMIIGHNPSLHQLAVDLTGQGEERLLDEMTRRFPTASLAEIQCPANEWSEVGPHSGTLRRFVIHGEMAEA